MSRNMGLRGLPIAKRALQVPGRPPAGYYDPALDAAERAGARGVGDLRLSIEQANQRAATDLTTGRTRLTQDRDTSLAALVRSRDRGLQDIGTGRKRLGEDFATDTQARERRYVELGAQHGEAATVQGVASGGTLAAAAAARAGNKGIEQAGAQRTFDRGMQDYSTGERRLGEDYATDVAGVNRWYQRGYDDLGTEYQRGVDDRGVQLGVAEREQLFFGQDTAAQRGFQAAAAGYVPPAAKKPKPKPKKKKG